MEHNHNDILAYLPALCFIGVASQQKAAHTSASAAVSAVLPAYCDPPNPCPIGYTAADGCIESEF